MVLSENGMLLILFKLTFIPVEMLLYEPTDNTTGDKKERMKLGESVETHQRVKTNNNREYLCNYTNLRFIKLQ